METKWNFAFQYYKFLSIPAIGILSILISVLFSPTSQAKIEQFIFGSKFDYYKLDRIDGRYHLGDQAVWLKTFNEYMPLFTSEIADSCPKLPKRPDLSVRAISGENTIRRDFFIQQRVVKAGSRCLSLDGDGLLYLPLHRKWFLPKQKDAIRFGSVAKAYKDDKLVFHAIKKNGSWHNKGGDGFVDWDKILLVLDSMKSYTPDTFLHISAGDSKPSFKILTGSSEYQFYKVADNLWAVKHPKRGWLEATESWAFWLDMGSETLIDRNSKFLKVITDSEAPQQKRIDALGNIGQAWSDSVRVALRGVLLDTAAPKDLKLRIIRKFRKKPSDKSFDALIQYLKISKDSELQMLTTRALRVRNPQGKVIDPEMEEEGRKEIVREWLSWWAKLDKSNSP